MSTFFINLESFGAEKIMAKKQINMQGVTQNRTSVSCNHPNLLISSVLSKIEK